MDVGSVNGGYSHFKWRYKKRRGMFPSVRGPARELIQVESQSVNGITLADDDERQWFVGDLALEQCGRLLSRPEGRDWILSSAYGMYWQAALSEMTSTFHPVEIQVVTGLPIDYYAEQRGLLRERLEGEHKVRRVGRSTQSFTISEIVVLPELMGSLFCCTINKRGQEVDNIASLGHVGIVDVGGHNTNFMGIEGMVPRRAESRSIDAGCWQAVQLVQTAIDTQYPGLNLHDHQVVECMIARSVKWRRKRYDIGGIVDNALVSLAEAVIAVMSQLWNGASGFDLILLTGGGALLIADHIRREFAKPGYPVDFVQVFGSAGLLPELAGLIGDVDPVFGNVEGMYRYGLFRFG